MHMSIGSCGNGRMLYGHTPVTLIRRASLDYDALVEIDGYKKRGDVPRPRMQGLSISALGKDSGT